MHVSQNLMCVTPLSKQVFQKKHVVFKPVTLQTSPDKQKETNLNKNVIASGMYKVVTKQGT